MLHMGMVAQRNRRCVRRADIQSQVMEYIRSADVSAGSKLPPLRELSSRFNVSVATLRRAVVDMEKNGQVDIRHGSGVYVADEYDEFLIETIILQPDRKNKTICIIESFAKGEFASHFVDNFVLSECVQGVREVCRREKWGLKVLSFERNEGRREILHRLEQDKENVALIVIVQDFISLLESVEELKIPTVSIGPLGFGMMKYEICRDLFAAAL